MLLPAIHDDKEDERCCFSRLGAVTSAGPAHLECPLLVWNDVKVLQAGHVCDANVVYAKSERPPPRPRAPGCHQTVVPFTAILRSDPRQRSTRRRLARSSLLRLCALLEVHREHRFGALARRARLRGAQACALLRRRVVLGTRNSRRSRCRRKSWRILILAVRGVRGVGPVDRVSAEEARLRFQLRRSEVLFTHWRLGRWCSEAADGTHIGELLLGLLELVAQRLAHPLQHLELLRLVAAPELVHG